MAGRLVIRLTQPQTDDVEWLVCDENNALIEGPFQTPFSEFSLKAAHYPVIVLVPGIALQILHTSIPKTSRSNLLKAIPFAAEEHIADNVANIHFAILEMKDNSQTIAAIARRQMDEWLNKLGQYGIKTEWMIPDVYALPETGTTWFALCDRNIVLCSCGSQLKFAAEKENFYHLMRLILESEQYPKPTHLEIICDDLATLKLPNGAISINGEHIHCTAPTQSTFSYLVKHLPKSATINLLQGDYQPAHTRSLIKRTWKFAAYAIALLFLTFIINDVVQYLHLNRQHKKAQEQIEQLYRNVFPAATSVIAPKERFERELSQLHIASEGSPLLSLFAQAAPVVKQSKDITIEGLEFRDQKLTLKIRSNNFQNIDNVVSALKQKNLKVEQREAQRSDNFATSNIIIGNP